MKTTHAFKKESMSLLYISSPDNYNIYYRSKILFHMSVTEFRIYTWKSGLFLDAILDRVGYSSTGDIPRAYAGWVHVTSNITCISSSETFFKDRNPAATSTRRRKCMWCLEHKIVVFVKHIITKFIKPGELVEDLFTANFSTAREYMLLPKNRLSVGCVMDSALVEAAKPSVFIT